MQIPTIEVSQVPDPLPVPVLDVREPIEWQHGHIEGALHIPLGELMERVGEVPREGQLLVVCKVGGRSGQAVAWLQQQGIEAINVDGGMLEWSAAGRPMVAESGDPMVV